MTASSIVLVADIGGTNARFALADLSSAKPLIDDSIREFAATAFPSLAEAARHYLTENGATDVTQGVFAVAGHVGDDEVRLTNHPWVISRAATQTQLRFERLHLINDFTAQAMAIRLLESADVTAIGAIQWHPQPSARSRTYAIIGPGTGLGAGGLLIRDHRCYPLAAEGGHTGFSPQTPEEIRILETLSKHFGRVSNERLICGPGLVNIYRALSEMASFDPERLEPADITARALLKDPLCTRTIDIFCAIFGTLAGDLALTLGAWDGVFLTGGLVPRLLDSLRDSEFRQRFELKGRFASTMAKIPSLAILHPQPGLLGAAAYAVDSRRHT
ncbi:MAG: glucokinase [Xanthomonadaceae bacterium]|jgi:glucokinase|nr:glucokinase [Xanthomonadaceae bacterium]